MDYLSFERIGKEKNTHPFTSRVMARSPRNGTAAAPPANNTPTVAARTGRRRQSVSVTTASTAGPSTPSASSLTPYDDPSTPASSSSKFHTPGGVNSLGRIEPKAHALRSVGGAADRVPCPFPANYGGSERCGVWEEDEADEVLMAVCAACASTVS